MGQDIFHDTFVARAGERPKTHQLFSKAILGASQVLTVEAVGLRVKADPDVVAVVAPNVKATLVVEGQNQSEFPTLQPQAIAPPPPPPSPDPSPDDSGADDAAAEPAPEPDPAPQPPADAESYVPDATDPFDGQGQAKFAATTGEMRGTQSYMVSVMFADALWNALGERPFELVAYLVGRRRSL